MAGETVSATTIINAGFRTGSWPLGSGDFKAQLASGPATPRSALGADTAVILPICC